MGFLNKLFGGEHKQEITFNAPVNGQLVEATQIPDPTFAESMLGPTIAILPGDDCTVYAPCDGVVSQIFKTGHAVTITGDNKAEILIHVGINTVDLKGEGFSALVQDDQKVKAGDPLIRFDRAVIEKAGYDLHIPVVVCNAMDFAEVKLVDNGNVTTKDVICHIVPKA